MRNYPNIGLQAPDILLPTDQVDLKKWSVVACDQFTSDMNYWEIVRNFTSGHPSTYHLILPEAYLGKELEKSHQAGINHLMEKYLNSSIFRKIEGFILVERETQSGIRKGLITALDLEKYDFHENSASLIRATEGTIVERLPPRIRIRQSAPLEVPHILVLIDDPDFKLIEPVSKKSNQFQKVYDFDLMQGGGRIQGYQVDNLNVEKAIISSLETLASSEIQEKKYGGNQPPLLYAVGDGNHSLATAKSIWDDLKGSVYNYHPARFALVELVNVHDPSINFEPIHRILSQINFDIWAELNSFFDTGFQHQLCNGFDQLSETIRTSIEKNQTFGIINQNEFGSCEISAPAHTLTVGSVQLFLDILVKKYASLKIDYIHGDEAIIDLAQKPGACGFILPAMDKHKLFKSVIKDGPLPRKTFSMGEAHEKRYYLECRKIKEG